MKNLGLFCLLFVLALGACRKNTDVLNKEENPFDPPVLDSWVQQVITVDGSVTGFVVDENDEPVDAASVRIGNMTTTTDAFGHFFFNDVQLNELGTLVKIEKAGYFNGSRRFAAKKDSENRVKIQLITKNFDSFFDAAVGGVVETNGGASVKFGPNTIRYADGTPYTGTVQVAAYWMDPSSLQTLDQMPGNLQGVNLLAEEVALQTAGMMAVELESPDGEPLNILDGNTAELTMPIPANLVASAPDEVPTWSYNETHGMWVEEGVSTKEGDSYIANVSHFSFWNVDVPYDLVEFSATFQDADGNPIENYLVIVTTTDQWFIGHDFTNEDGLLMGFAPVGVSMVVSVYGFCGELVYEETFDPIDAPTDLGTIEIPASQFNPTVISGNLVDCDGNNLANGVAVINFDGQTIYEYTDGEPFSYTFSTCVSTSDVEIYGVDLANFLQSDVTTVAAGSTTDLGDVSVCEDIQSGYFSVTVDGVEMVYTDLSLTAEAFTDPANPIGYRFSHFPTVGSQQILLDFGVFESLTPGNFDDTNHFFFPIEDYGIELSLYPLAYTGDYFAIDQFEIVEVGDVGEPIKGNFSGTMLNSFEIIPITDGVEVQVSGSFSAILQ